MTATASAPAKKKKPAPVKSKRASSAASSSGTEKVAGLYRPNTPKANYLTQLMDGKPHTLAELAKGAKVTNYQSDPIYYLRKDGAEKKLWKIEHDRETGYTLIPTAAGKKALGL